jgi:hypothetical protein
VAPGEGGEGERFKLVSLRNCRDELRVVSKSHYSTWPDVDRLPLKRVQPQKLALYGAVRHVPFD